MKGFQQDEYLHAGTLGPFSIAASHVKIFSNLRPSLSSQEVEKGTDPASPGEEATTTEMSNLKTGLLQTSLEWHSAEEIPPLHVIEYAGESWLQSEPLLLVNTAGKLAVGYCQQEQGGCSRFEVGASGEAPGEISFWAIVQAP